jgi:hypothetical protein
MATKVLLVAIGMLILLGGWYLWSPSGGSLKSINESGLAQFTTQFESAGGKERVLLLVSPT